VIGYEGAVKISMLMLFPPDHPYEYPRFKIQESRNTPSVDYNGLRIVQTNEERTWFYWEIPEPEHDHVYQIHWTWK
jgi:eukaryotic-like serine/threonine-protein kinase